MYRCIAGGRRRGRGGASPSVMHGNPTRTHVGGRSPITSGVQVSPLAITLVTVPNASNFRRLLFQTVLVHDSNSKRFQFQAVDVPNNSGSRFQFQTLSISGSCCSKQFWFAIPVPNASLFKKKPRGLKWPRGFTRPRIAGGCCSKFWFTIPIPNVADFRPLMFQTVLVHDSNVKTTNNRAPSLCFFSVTCDVAKFKGDNHDHECSC